MNAFLFAQKTAFTEPVINTCKSYWRHAFDSSFIYVIAASPRSKYLHINIRPHNVPNWDRVHGQTYFQMDTEVQAQYSRTVTPHGWLCRTSKNYLDNTNKSLISDQPAYTCTPLYEYSGTERSCRCSFDMLQLIAFVDSCRSCVSCIPGANGFVHCYIHFIWWVTLPPTSVACQLSGIGH